MMYAGLCTAIPIVGVAVFAALWVKMERDGIVDPPVGAFFTVFAGYGAVLLLGAAEMFHAWSAMHSLAFAGMLLVGVHWFVVQGTLLRRSRPPTPYHRTASNLSLGLPIAMLALLGLAFIGQL